jgi:hypothetical protein
VRTVPFRFSVSKFNPFLGDWDVPMPPGSQRGVMSSHLVLLKIPEAGEYLLKFEARSYSDFESCGIYQIIVENKDATSRKRCTQKENYKDRYTDLKGKVLSVTTGRIISLH